MHAIIKIGANYNRIKIGPDWLKRERPDLHEKVERGQTTVEQAFTEAGVQFPIFSIQSHIPRELAIAKLNAFYDELEK